MSWKDDYRFGTLLLLPPEPVSSHVDKLRAEYDPESYKTCVAHISLTQPFLDTPTDDEIALISDLLTHFNTLNIEYGPVEMLGESCVVYRIEPKQEIISIRERLHATGLFNLSLPFTEGFIPHMTISEAGIPDAQNIIADLNHEHSGGVFQCDQTAYFVPNRHFVFELENVFKLSGS